MAGMAEMAWSDHFRQSEPTATEPAPVGRLEAKAEELILAGLRTPAARRQYAAIATALGWRCWGQTWEEWATEVNDERGNPNV